MCLCSHIKLGTSNDITLHEISVHCAKPHFNKHQSSFLSPFGWVACLMTDCLTQEQSCKGLKKKRKKKGVWGTDLAFNLCVVYTCKAKVKQINKCKCSQMSIPSLCFYLLMDVNNQQLVALPLECLNHLLRCISIVVLRCEKFMYVY